MDERFAFNSRTLCEIDGRDFLKYKSYAMNTEIVLYEEKEQDPWHVLFSISKEIKNLRFNLWVKSKLKLMLKDSIEMESLGYEQKSFSCFERMKSNGIAMKVERIWQGSSFIKTCMGFPVMTYYDEYHQKGMVESVAEFEKKYNEGEFCFADMNEKLRDLVLYGLSE